MQEEKQTVEKKRSWPRRIGRIFLKTLLFLFLFIIVVFLLILTPPVQRFLTTRAENFLEKKLDTKVEIGRIGFGLSGNIRLLDFYIQDKSNDTLVAGEAIKANLNFLKLFSNEVEVKDIELQNITAKITRQLPDTTFNFQFIIDAFTSEQAAPDTAQTAPMKLNISDITLDNVAITYRDVITGIDMYSRIGYATTTIDKLEPETQTFDFPSLILRNTTVRMKQTKPLLEPTPISQDMAEAQAPAPMNLNIGVIDLTKIKVQYDNDVSALYSNVSIGKAKIDGRVLDLENNRVYLDELSLANTVAAIRLGRSQGAASVKKEAKEEVAAESTTGWDFRVDKIRFDNTAIRYNDETQPELSYGMDYSHLKVDDLTLHANDFVFNPDSTALTIVKGSMKEKSGFVLTDLQGDILYGSNQTYLKNLLIKTPGSEIKRSAALQYASLAELQNNIERTVIDLDVVNSYLQVKDILLFAPQLRTQPAFRNENDVWNFNLIANGTMDRLNVERLQFDGLQNTQVNAAGTLLGLANPQNAGGNFTIYRFHTTKADMALFTPPDLSQQIDLPQDVNMSGLIRGNTGRLFTRLDVNTTDGNLDFNGSFANLTNPAALSYDATIRASGLRLGKILRQQGQIGNLTGSFSANGRGVTPDGINTKFNVNINNVGYNGYAYRNIRMNGSLRKTVFDISGDVADPNVDATFTASGDYAAYGPFSINAQIDSVKAHNLGFSQERLIFRGAIRGTADDVNTGTPTADILLTDALVVSGENRLPIDSLQVLAGTDSTNFLVLRSNIASAELRGQYNLLQLGDVIQNTLAPYFSTATVKPAPVDPYDIRFRAELYLSPALQGFVPDLKEADSVRLRGTLTTDEGLNAVISAADLVYQTNVVRNLEATINTNDSGLLVNATVDRLKAAGLDVYATRVNATAMNNNINFAVGIEDKEQETKYYLSGLVTQSANGDMTVQLAPDSLRLNYERWQVAQDNRITLSNGGIYANNFVLSQGGQQLSVQSQGATPDSPLQVRFDDFRLSTVSAFLNPDSTMIDGLMNGTATFTNLTEQPLFTSDLTVSNLTLMQDTVGNLNAQVSSTANRYNADITLTGRGNDLAITGYAEPGAEDIALNLDLAIRQLRLNTFQGAAKDFLTDASGNIKGNVSIRGTTSNPAIDGKLNFDDASVTTVAIGGPFRIDNESLIAVNNEGLLINQFTIRDSANNALTFDGKVGTTDFTEYNLDIDIRARDFMAVNSTKTQNSLFYGKLNLSTNMHIGGSAVAPVIDGSLTVNDRTDFTLVLPQEDPGVVSREGVVEFVNFSDSAATDSLFVSAYDSLNRSALTGFEVAVNLIVDKEAIFNVVIDEANGDLVNLQGEANLSAGIDPSGKINLTGTYEISQGAYQLSYNFIQRRFEIEQGSRIEWYGDPTSAQVDMTAIYIANTAPLDLVSDFISASNTAIRNTYLQKLPFQVVLNMEGELMQPEIDFDIRLPTDRNYNVSSDIISNVDTRLTQLRQEPSELNKQVFSLLLLGRFVGENPFESSGDGFSAGAYARQSVSKLLTEQLNNLAGNLIAGVDLNFDVTSSDDYTTGSRRNRTDLNVGLSKQLLNNRLTVSVGSNFELEGPQNSNQEASNLAGNVAVSYLLSRDGRYMLRAYRKNEYFGVVDGYIIETGLRFIITLDYDRFANLFRRKKLTPEKERNENKESE